MWSPLGIKAHDSGSSQEEAKLNDRAIMILLHLDLVTVSPRKGSKRKKKKYRKEEQDTAKPLHFHEYEKNLLFPLKDSTVKKKKKKPINTAQNQVFEKGPCFSA